MGGRASRIENDLKKVKELCLKSNGAINIISQNNEEIELEFKYRTIENSSGKIINKSIVEIEFGPKYPFIEPKAFFKSEIFHPNVYTSGQICFGIKWVGSQTLDFLVERIANIIIFDSNILNLDSPANSTAVNWYKKTIRNNPDIFPTDTFVKQTQTKKSTIKWKNVSNNNFVVKNCPSCNQALRLPTGKKLKVTCRKCKQIFETKT